MQKYEEISKELKRLMGKKGQYEEALALALCTEDACRQDKVIQRQKINILFKLERYEDIVVECEKAYVLWKDEGFIKSKLIAISNIIKKLIKEEKYEEALALCTDKNCELNNIILSQRIDILSKLGRVEEALALCTDKNCELNNMILSQRIDILSKLGRAEEALALCTEDACRQDKVIQRQKINILFKLERYEYVVVECKKYYVLWKDERFIKPKLIAISNIIKKLIKEEKYDEALKLCHIEICQYDSIILSQRIDILSKLGRLEEALALCTDAACKQNIVIRRQKITILSKLEESEEINIYLTKIYYADFNEDELNNLSLDLWDNLIIHIAYYEKYNKKKGLQYLKQILKTIDLTLDQKKIINRLKERFITNKNIIFDCSIYCDILKCRIDWDYNSENKQLKSNEDISYDNYLYFDTMLEQAYDLARNNKITKLKTLIKEYLKNTSHLGIENTIMRLVDVVMQNIIPIEIDEYEWNYRFAILIDTLNNLGCINSKKAEYYLEKRIRSEYFGEEARVYKYSKINEMDVDYNYNIPNIDYYLEGIKERCFAIDKSKISLEDYSYLLCISARELFKQGQIEEGERLLKLAIENPTKEKDKELKFFIKAIDYQKEILPFKEVVPFDEEIRRILKIM